MADHTSAGARAAGASTPEMPATDVPLKGARTAESLPPETQAPARRKLQQMASGVLYALLLLLAVWVVRDFIPSVAWAGVIAIALWPMLRRAAGYALFKGRTTLLAVVATVGVGILIVLPVVMAFAQAAREAHDLLVWFKQIEDKGLTMPDLINHLPFGSRQITDWWQANLAQPLSGSPAIQKLHGDAVMSLGRQFGVRAVHGLMVFGFMLVTLFVIFQAGPRLSASLLKGVQRAFGCDGAVLVEHMATAVRSTVVGLVVVGLGEGALLGGGYLLTGIPHAALLAMVTAVAAMLPFCAPVVYCGAALWLLVQGADAAAVGLVVYGFVVVFVAEHFVRPCLIGNSSRLPFLLVLFGILGGAQTFGLLGIFIGPALMTVLMVLWNDWVR
jgi:predicted PurR-regulated permease PerM